MKETISKILAISVIATGAGTLLVFAVPDLITVGLFLLIVPGLILGVTPTVFLYVSTFSIGWFCLNHRGVEAGAAAGLAAVGALAFGLPFLMNQQSTVTVMQARAKEKSPATKVDVPRVVGLKRPRYQTNACDPMCQMLLYSNPVERVVWVPINEKESNRAVRSFRIERSDSCPDTDKLLKGSSWAFDNNSSNKTEDLRKAVRLRIAGGECLIDTEWFGTPDWILEQVDEEVGPPAAGLTPLPGPTHVQGFQILVQGKVFARQSRLQARPLTTPLLLEPYGGSELKMYGFRFSRQAHRQEPLDVGPFLERFTNLNPNTTLAVDPEMLRKRIDAMLDDPTVPGTNGVFSLLKDFYDEIRTDGAQSGDVRRLSRLISDNRVLQLDGLPLHKLFTQQQLKMYNPIMDRLVDLARSGNLPVFHALALKLQTMPPSAFTKVDPRVDLLLANNETRRNAPVLVKRLAARGPREAARLLQFVSEGYERKPGAQAAHFAEDAEAALHGLCDLGISARAVLPSMHRLAEEGRVPPRQQDSDLWRATLVALGDRPEDFNLPKDRHWKTDLYQQHLRRLAANHCERL